MSSLSPSVAALCCALFALSALSTVCVVSAAGLRAEDAAVPQFGNPFPRDTGHNMAQGGVSAPGNHMPVHHQEPLVHGTLVLNEHLVTVNEKIIDGTVIDIQWLDKHHNYQTLFMLTDTYKLYRSADGGKTWVDQMPMITARSWSRGPGHSGFVAIIVSEADPDTIVFEGRDGKHAITSDAGRSYHPIDHTEHLSEFKLHPKERNMIMASTLSHKCTHADAEGTCYKNLYVTHDSGATWRFLTHYVVQFDWAHNLKRGQADHLPMEGIFASLVSSKMGHQNFGQWDARVDFVLSCDMFATHTTLVPRGNRFLFTDKFLCVAQVSAAGHHVGLQLSSDGSRSFIGASMPYAIQQHSYTILDTSEDTIFLHVNHEGEGAQWGHVYISNALGTNFTLSLPHNRRDENGKCDFEKLQSMEGVYIANYIANTEDLAAQAQRLAAADTAMGQENDATPLEQTATIQPQIMTVISHDKGATWTYLQPPPVDALRRPVHCLPHQHCHLHLHGVTDVFGPFYSTPSAVGLMMATGCLGDRLCFDEGEINTYMSRDAGHTWDEVSRGSHIYEFGDHGGLLVMAQDDSPTSHIKYSWNEGETWYYFHITDTPVLVDNIMIEPTSRELKFVVYGTRKDSAGVRSGVVFLVDFTHLHTPSCHGLENVGLPGSDFEHWSPSATENNDMCLLGHTVMYVRRKQHTACRNGMEHEPHHTVKHCQCTDHDYECDMGYVREHGTTGPCIRDPTIPLNPKPAHCPHGSYYHVTDGYRKIAGDTCVGGSAHPMKAFPCAGSGLESTSLTGWIVLSSALLLIICLASMSYCQKRHMDPFDSIPVVGAVLGAAFGLVTGVIRWVWDRIPIPSSGGRPSGGSSFGSGSYQRVPGGNQGMDAFDFDEQGDDEDLGLGDLALPDDGEPTVLEPGTLARAVGSRQRLGSTSGSSANKKRT